MLSFSYSKLSDYAKCPAYFKFRHIDKVPVEEQDILVKGSAIHAILAKYTLTCYQERQTHLYDKWEAIASQVISEMNILPEYEDEIMQDVKSYVEANEVELEGLAGVEEKVAIDKDFKVVGWLDENVWFRAIFDKLYIADNIAKISDYKTGYSMSPDTFQLEIYAWLAYRIYPQLEFMQVEFDFTRFSFKKIFEIGKERLPVIQRKVKSRIERISLDTNFNPKINTLCSRCPFWNLCPAIAGMSAKGYGIIPVPKTKKEASEMLEMVVAQEKRTDEIKKVLKTYCEEMGEVKMNDMKAFIKPITNIKWDVAEVLKWATENQVVGFTNALTINNVKVKKFNVPEVYSRKEIGTRFTIGAIKEEKELDK